MPCSLPITSNFCHPLDNYDSAFASLGLYVLDSQKIESDKMVLCGQLLCLYKILCWSSVDPFFLS